MCGRQRPRAILLLLLLLLCVQACILASVIHYLQDEEQAARVSLACIWSRPAPTRLAAQRELPPRTFPLPAPAHGCAAEQGPGDGDAAACGVGGVEEQEEARENKSRSEQQRQPPLRVPHSTASHCTSDGSCRGARLVTRSTSAAAAARVAGREAHQRAAPYYS